MRVLILFIFLITIVSCSKEQELTPLDRCIEANMPELNETQRKDIINEISYSYKAVFPDETSKEQLKWFGLEDGWDFRTLADLSNGQEYYDSLEADEINVRGITKEIENFKNVYDYNIEYYGLSVEVVLEELMEKEATRICNSQGVY